MKRSSKVTLWVVLAVGFVALVGAAAGLVWYLTQEKVAGGTILEVDFEEAFVEYVPADPFAAFMFDKKMRLRDMVDALHAAAEDDRVAALVARVTPVGMGMAQVEELRDAVLAFRAAGKPAVAYADTFGEVGAANGAYYLASAFDEIYIQPSGDVGLTGLRFESPFLRGTFDKLEIEPQMAQRYEYKNAMNTFTETGYTDAHREAMQTLADSMYAQIVGAVAESRGLDEAAVRAAVDGGPFIGQEAVEAGLVDGLLYRDQVYDRVRALAAGEATAGEAPPAVAETAAAEAEAAEGEEGDDDGEDDDEEDERLLYLRKYWQRADKPYAKGEHTIGLVYAIGGVVRGEGGYDPLGGSFTMGGEAVSAALRAAMDHDDVEAIILRVDSPGGSYVASDQIWREVVRARAKGIPVVASMGDLAASGGYFVSMHADKIVAHPTTITGSIGVLGGKLVTRDMWNDKLGISFDSVQTAEHADIFSSLEPYGEAEWAKFNSWLDRVYEDFTSKVAEGRDIPKERVLEIAKGRVWTGADALRLGLVDELGGFPEAIRLAKEAAGIDEDVKVKIREFPGKKNPFEELFGEGPENSEDEMTRVALTETLAAVRPLVRAGRQVGLLPGDEGLLRMPPIEGPEPR